jgi:GNAT superfamily N-acetyltransferase
LSEDSHCIREIEVTDAEAAAKLSDELGYPVSENAMARRIESVTGLRDHVVYVACVSNTVVGWIDVGVVHHLQGEPYGEIGGFVVSSDYRSAGIGRRLIERAERWVAQQGIRKMVVRSQIAREAAHRFYLREGYSRTKTSAVFSKDLA